MPHLNEMGWDDDDMLVKVDLGGGGTAYYRYDSSGNRVRKVIVNGSVKKERLYVGEWELWQQSSSGTVQTERETLSIADNEKTFLQLETLTIDSGSTVSSPTTNWRYQYDNHLGSASLELDSSANIISYEEYYPFGATSYRSGKSAVEVSLKRYRYCGKERDDETGLYYYGARYYAAWIGRFISIDPLAEKFPQLTPYNYAGNKPITYKDLHGLQSSGGDIEVKTTPRQEGEKSTETVSYINALDGIEQKISKTVYYHSGFLGKEDNYSEKEYLELFRPLIRSIGQGQEDMCVLTDLDIADEMYTKLSDWAEQAYNYYGGQIPLARGNVDAMGYDSPFFLLGSWSKFSRFGTGVRAANSEMVNLASSSRTAHIIAGDVTGGGHAWFGSVKSFLNGLKGNKSMFPATWSNKEIMNGISEVVTSNPWVQQTGRSGAMLTRSGQPVRFVTEGYYNGVKIRVINTHNEIITAFPIK